MAEMRTKEGLVVGLIEKLTPPSESKGKSEKDKRETANQKSSRRK